MRDIQFHRYNANCESQAGIQDIPILPETTTKPANRRVDDE